MNREKEIRRDLSRNVQAQIGDVLERNLAIAQVVLPVHEIIFLMVEVAVMAARTAGATCANTVGDFASDAEIAVAYDAVIDAIQREVRDSRADALRRAMAEIKSRRAQS